MITAKCQILFCLILIFALPRPAVAQNFTCSQLSTCFECLLQAGCGYCMGSYSGNTACHVGNSSGPTDATASQCEFQYGDSWIYAAQDCPDPCANDISRQECQQCIEDPANGQYCGWCQDGAGCRTGTLAGPWSPSIPNCDDWRYPGMYNLTDNEVCKSLSPCNQSHNCGECVETQPTLQTYCIWCGDPSNNDKGVCLDANTTATCASYNSAWTKSVTLDSCPPSISPANALVIDNIKELLLRSLLALLFFVVA